MIINIYIGGVISATADGKLLREIPPFFPEFGDGIHTLDTDNLPEGIREEFEEKLLPYILEG